MLGMYNTDTVPRQDDKRQAESCVTTVKDGHGTVRQQQKTDIVLDCMRQEY